MLMYTGLSISFGVAGECVKVGDTGANARRARVGKNFGGSGGMLHRENF